MTSPPSQNPPDTSPDGLEELSQRAKRGFLWMGASTGILQTVSWLLTLITARLLHPSDYGIVALAETALPYLSLVAGFNLNNWMIQRESLSDQERACAYTLSFTLGILMAGTAFLIAPLLGDFYEHPELVLPFQALSVGLLFLSLTVVPAATLQRELRLKPIALKNMTVGIARGLLTLLLAYLGFGYWALVIGILMHEIGSMVWLSIAARVPLKLGWKPGIIREALRFGAAATAAHILWVIFNTVDAVAIGRLLSLEILGYYSMAFFLTDLPMSKLNILLRPVLMPYFSRIRHSKEHFSRSFLRVMRGIACFTFPALIGLGIIAYEAVTFFLGAKWEPLIPILQVMCVVGLVRGATSNVEPLLIAVGRPGLILKINALRATIMPPMFFLLTFIFGINGIFATWLFIFPFTSYLLLHVTKEFTSTSPIQYLSNLRGPFVASLIMAIASLGTIELFFSESDLLVTLAVKILLGAAVYLTTLLLLFRREALELLDAWREIRGGR